MKQPEQLYFLDYFEESLVIDDDIIQKVSKFIQTVCYNRFKELELEFIKRIRIRIYKKWKQNLPNVATRFKINEASYVDSIAPALLLIGKLGKLRKLIWRYIAGS